MPRYIFIIYDFNSAKTNVDEVFRTESANIILLFMTFVLN